MHILVVDDHPIICDALAKYLEQIGTQLSGTPISVTSVNKLAEAIATANSSAPDLVFLDLNLDSQNLGTTTLERFQGGTQSRLPVVVFTGLSPGDDGAAEIVRRCLSELGARYIILKGVNLDAMFVGLKRILAGEQWASEEIFSLLLKPSAVKHSLDLTPRQWDVARGVSRGLQNKEIAVELGLAPSNVRQIVTAIYKRLGVRGRVELADAVADADGGRKKITHAS